MNKEVAIIGGGIIGGAVSNGVSTLLPQTDSPIMNIVIAGASGFGATKVHGNSTKDNLLKGALLGSCFVQALTAIKKFADKNLSSKLTGVGKGTQFFRGAVGLGCPCEESGLAGAFMGADGEVYQYDETGLNGTVMDEAGNIFEVQDGLQGVYQDENGNLFSDGLNGVLDEVYDLPDDGLHGAEDDVYGIEDEPGLNGIEDTLYEEIY